MIKLYSFGSTNGHKVAIALEELDLPYEVQTVDVFRGEGQTPEFLTLNPLGKIPVIHDTETGLQLTESNAILSYLAEKAGRLAPKAEPDRRRAQELLYLQASQQGPMFGQRMYFSIFAPETIPHAIRRYEAQCAMIDAVVNGILAKHDYLAGEDYSIVDIAFFSWYHAAKWAGFSTAEYGHLTRWFERISVRPAVVRGTQIPAKLPKLPPRKQI